MEKKQAALAEALDGCIAAECARPGVRGSQGTHKRATLPNGKAGRQRAIARQHRDHDAKSVKWGFFSTNVVPGKDEN